MIRIAARDSLLSIAQVEEVLEELRNYYPNVFFNPIFVKTKGDIDKTTSLRSLDKTDFFTREIDEILLEGRCDVAIHSAKDLPEPLRKGLVVAAITKGLDSRDALVYQGELMEDAIVATSSLRREECVKKIRPKARFVDIRGKIEERLKKIEEKEVDAVVIAEAAIIRLKLTHLSRIYLEGETALHQGRLAIVVREDDVYLREFFSVIDAGY